MYLAPVFWGSHIPPPQIVSALSLGCSSRRQSRDRGTTTHSSARAIGITVASKAWTPSRVASSAEHPLFWNKLQGVFEQRAVLHDAVQHRHPQQAGRKDNKDPGVRPALSKAAAYTILIRQTCGFAESLWAATVLRA